MWIEAEASGFILPGLDGLTAASLAERGPGWSAAVLFLHQGRAAAERLAGLGQTLLCDAARTLDESLAEPIWLHLAAQLPRLPGCDHVLLCEDLLPAAAAMEAERRDLSELPYLGITAADALDDEHGETIGEILSWLLVATWALNAALHPGRVIGCFGSSGAVAHWISEGEDLDRYLLRCFLNDVPLLQCAPEIAEHLPRSVEEWVFADAVALSSLEVALPEPQPAESERAGDHESWPKDGWTAVIGDWEIHFSPLQDGEGMETLAMGLARTPAGSTLIEVFIDEEGRPRLQQLPLRYGGEELGERVELLEERLEAALHATSKGKPSRDEHPRQGLL